MRMRLDVDEPIPCYDIGCNVLLLCPTPASTASASQRSQSTVSADSCGFDLRPRSCFFRARRVPLSPWCARPSFRLTTVPSRSLRQCSESVRVRLLLASLSHHVWLQRLLSSARGSIGHAIAARGRSGLGWLRRSVVLRWFRRRGQRACDPLRGVFSIAFLRVPGWGHCEYHGRAGSGGETIRENHCHCHHRSERQTATAEMRVSKEG